MLSQWKWAKVSSFFTFNQIEFSESLNELSNDDSIRAMILTGSGRAFSAGGDLAFLQKRSLSSAPKNAEMMV